MNPSMALHRLIYCSRQNIRAAQLDIEIGDIITLSIRNNRRIGVTGLLLAHQGWFLQVLEGPAVAVQTTYGRILNDNRHSRSHVISANPLDEPAFEQWAMCARRLRADDDAILDVLDAKGAFNPVKLGATSSLRLLMAVRNIRTRDNGHSEKRPSTPAPIVI